MPLNGRVNERRLNSVTIGLLVNGLQRRYLTSFNDGVLPDVDDTRRNWIMEFRLRIYIIEPGS